jgi:hypothetical protein
MNHVSFQEKFGGEEVSRSGWGNMQVIRRLKEAEPPPSLEANERNYVYIYIY